MPVDGNEYAIGLSVVMLLILLLMAGLIFGVTEGTRTELNGQIKAYEEIGATTKAKLLKAERDGLLKTRVWILAF